MATRVNSSLHIRFEFDPVVPVNKERTGYKVNCVTYTDKKVVSSHHLADAVWEANIGLFVFPIESKSHKSVRNAFMKMYPMREVSDKAKWTDNGFLFKAVID